MPEAPSYLEKATLPIPDSIRQEEAAWRMHPSIVLSAESADALLMAFHESQNPDPEIVELLEQDGIMVRLKGNLMSHAIRVAVVGLALNDRLRIDHALAVAKAHLRHDTGKGDPRIREIIAIPRIIPRTSRAWQVVKTHPEIGARVLQAEMLAGAESMTLMDRLEVARLLRSVRLHHENMGGTGYYGIPGKEIPPVSRLVAVADTVDAMLAGEKGGRRGGRSRTPMEVLAEIHRCDGRSDWDRGLTGKRQDSEAQFDPEIVRTLRNEVWPHDEKGGPEALITYIRPTDTDPV